MRSNKNTRQQQGTALLEILSAIAILTACAIGVVMLYTSGFRATKEAHQELAAARLLANELEAWRIAAAQGLSPADAAPLKALATEDRFLEDLKGSVKITPAPEAPAGLYEVTVHLRWTGPGNRNLHRESTTLIFAHEAQP